MCTHLVKLSFHFHIFVGYKNRNLMIGLKLDTSNIFARFQAFLQSMPEHYHLPSQQLDMHWPPLMMGSNWPVFENTISSLLLLLFFMMINMRTSKSRITSAFPKTQIKNHPPISQSNYRRLVQGQQLQHICAH